MTTRVRVETLEIPAAALGAPSVLPDVGDGVAAPYATDERFGYGRVPNLFPYLHQDGYGRELRPTPFRAVVLENRHLTAVVLPELGGRIWSLRDRARDVDLVYRNGAVQLGNLALRNAWFAGGIEYNIGTRGHSPLTCSPLHAATVVDDGGEPSVRLWEYERQREVVFQIDLWLPSDSPVLLAHVRIVNPGDDTVPMYWWTNAAVPQTPETRVLCPARTALTSDYTGALRQVPVDRPEERLTWPAAAARAADYFFETDPDADRYWIVSADARGNGLALLSTAPLRGRKLFCWGTEAGGERWQEWLSPFGGRYGEIQAGLAATQYEHVPMPARSEWSWVEAYGNAALDPAIAHDPEWDAAVRHADERVAALWPAEVREEHLRRLRHRALLPPSARVVTGSGWGALERRRRLADGQPWLDETPTPFHDDTLTGEQRSWCDLLAGRPAWAPGPPLSYVRGADWERRLAGTPSTWPSELHLAVMAHARGAHAEADRHYRRSLEHAATPWALRGLARLAADAGRSGDAAALYRQALALTDDGRLVEEACRHLLRAGQPAAVLDRLCGPDIPGPRTARLRLLLCRALAAAGDLPAARRVLEDGLVLPDLHEGETTLSDLWSELFPGRPVPPAYDFRIA
ncbi:DUF5107 domain-containing protein [Jiangella rhizosphaerae]|uniref:DUF5107 domain-containing protein n=1 Tax=Jiangella rhizosphaerae TaxID=2293569 RepID=UPI00131470C4|nr:DUF5107 domain-containing protein [Jiangella rhizosphaerae]